MLKENGAWRRLVIEKPFGTDLASARALNARIARSIAGRAPDLPDRSLSRQGDGAEHPGAALRQRHVRADLERNHIDHVQITVDESSASATAAASTSHRRAARHGAEPSVPTARAGRDGAAGALRRAFGAFREGQVLDAIQHSEPRGSAAQTRCAANISRGNRRRGDRGLPRDRGRRARQHHRNLCRAEADDRQLALGGVPFYLRTGKALGLKRTEVAIKFKQAPLTMFRARSTELAQNFLIISVRPTEGHRAAVQRQGAGPTITIDGVEMKFNYGLLQPRSLHRLRDADL